MRAEREAAHVVGPPAVSWRWPCSLSVGDQCCRDMSMFILSGVSRANKNALPSIWDERA